MFRTNLVSRWWNGLSSLSRRLLAADIIIAAFLILYLGNPAAVLIAFVLIYSHHWIWSPQLMFVVARE